MKKWDKRKKEPNETSIFFIALLSLESYLSAIVPPSFMRARLKTEIPSVMTTTVAYSLMLQKKRTELLV